MSHGIRTDDRQLAEDLKLCLEATKDLMPDSVLYFRLDARRATGLIEELIDLRATLSRVEAERDGLRKKLDSGVITYERNGTIFHEVRPSWPTTTEGEKP